MAWERGPELARCALTELVASQESSLPSETQEQATGNRTKTKARSLLCDFRFTKQRLDLGAGTASDLGFQWSWAGAAGMLLLDRDGKSGVRL